MNNQFRPKDVLCHYSRDVRQCVDRLYREFMKGDNDILTWRGFENVTEALGIREADMDKLIKYWSNLRKEKTQSKEIKMNKGYITDMPLEIAEKYNVVAAKCCHYCIHSDGNSVKCACSRHKCHTFPCDVCSEYGDRNYTTTIDK